MSYKTIDELIIHLQNNDIAIENSQKNQLVNTGYFHGYKGYRFFKNSNNRIPINSYQEIYATINYDSKLKSILYSKLMFIETSVKNIALDRIMRDSNSENIQVMLEKVVADYHSFPANTDKATKKKAQLNKLKLEKDIQDSLFKEYNRNNPQIVHFYDKINSKGVPLWALFEILTLGDFAYLLSCLVYTTREHITSDLGMQVSSIDSNRELIYKYLYILKDLRNAVAHNSVVFDTRFCKFMPSKAMTKSLALKYKLQYVNFKNIDDYIFLICYYLELLKVSKEEICEFLCEFERIIDTYIKTVDIDVSNMVIHPNIKERINIVKSQI